MPTVTVQNLIDRAKATADMRDNFVTPSQWTQWATQERYALDLFLARSGWTLPLSDFDITVTGSEAGSFPVNPNGGVMAIVCVYEYNSQGRMRMLRPNDAMGFLKQVPGATGNPTGDSRSYRVQWTGDNLVLNLFPEPTAGETYRVVYIAHPRKLVLSLTATDPEIPATYASGTVLEDGMDIAATYRVAGTVGNGKTITFVGDLDTGTTTGLWVDGENAVYHYNIAPNFPTFATFAADAAGSAYWNITGNSGHIQLDRVLTASGGAELIPAEAEAWESTSVAYPMGWEERIVLGMARRALIKEESDTRGVDSEIQLWDARIEEACWNRVLTNSPTVRNTDDLYYGWTDRYSIPPVGLWLWP